MAATMRSGLSSDNAQDKDERILRINWAIR